MTSYFSNLFTKNELSSEEESSEGESSERDSSERDSSEGESSDSETSSIDEISESEINLAEEQDITENNNSNINEELSSSSSEEEKIEEQDITENTIIKKTQEVNLKENNIYKEFQCYASKKFLDAAKPYFENPRFSFSKMLYLNGLKSKTEKDAAKEWIAAYRIQRWWKNLDKKKIDMAKNIKFSYPSIGFPFLYV